jgi:hypothetical protein
MESKFLLSHLLLIKMKSKSIFLLFYLLGILLAFSIYNTHALVLENKKQKKKSKQNDLLLGAYSADLKIGPFKIQPFFSIKNVGYDSNIFYSPSEPVADFTATPTGGLRSIVLLGRRGFISFGGELGYLWFRRTSSQNFLNRYADAHLEIDFSRFSLFIEEGFAHVRDRYGWEIDIRTRHTTNSAAFGIKYEPSKKTSLQLILSQELLKYDSEAIFRGYKLGEILNHQKDSARLMFDYQMLPKTRALVEIDYTSNNFDNPTSDLNSHSYKALFGAEFDANALIQGTFKIGYKYLLFNSPDIENFKGLAGSASLGYKFIDRFSILFEYDRDTNFSYFAYYYIRDLYRSMLNFYLTYKFGIDLGATIINNKYPLSEARENKIMLNRINIYQLGFKYSLMEGLTTGIGGAYRVRRTNVGYDMDGFTIYSNFNYEY